MTTSVKPVAGDDHYTFTEAQLIGGNMLSNDIAGANGKLYLRDFDGDDVLAKIAGQVTDITGQYGTFHLQADGTWTYTLSDAAKVGFYAGMTLTETMQYKISDGAGHTDVGIFTLDIQGVTTKPVAVDDSFTFGENDAIGGNVLSNDIVGETGQLILRSVTGTDIGAKQGAVTDVSGTYGTFHFHADGSFTYDLDPTVKASLNYGQSVTEKLQYYTVSDGAGHTDAATITLTVNGLSDPATHTTAVTLTFNDVAIVPGLGRGGVSSDYHGFSLTENNLTLPVSDGSHNLGSGIYAASQGGNVAFNPTVGVPVDIQKTDHSTFDFNGGYFAMLTTPSEAVTFTGWHNGVQVYSDTVSLTSYTATHLTLDWQNIDDLQITSANGDQIAFDNLQFHV